MQHQELCIGREEELQMIDEMVRDPAGGRHMLPLVGAAGVGKTWLLHQVYQRYCTDPGILVVRIDYSESRPQSLPGLSLHVIEQFGAYMTDQQKTAYHKHMADWETLLQTEIDPDKIRAEQNKIYHFGIDLIWQISQEKRTIIVSDSLDTEASLEDIQRTNLLAANLPNTVMLLAGRATPFAYKLLEELAELYKRWNTHDIHTLTPFSPEETTAYLSKAVPADLPAPLRESVAILTAGHPVRVAISAAWLSQTPTLPDDGTFDPAALQALDDAGLSARRRDFERILVAPIQAQQTPVDRALLSLSYLDRRYEPRILQIALELDDQQQFEAVIAELHQHVFIRASMLTEGGLLHEEAHRLLKEHVWPAVDPDGTLRQALAEKVIEAFYQPEIERLDNIVQEKLSRSLQPTLVSPEHREKMPVPDEYWPKRDLQMECLFYHFCISEKRGWSYLNTLFDEAQTYHYSLIQMDAIVNAVHKLAPQQVDSAQFQVRVAQLLFEKGEVRRAANLAAVAVESPDITPADAAKGFIVLADSTTDPGDKVTNFKVALEMAEAAEDPILKLKIHNRLGLAYRRQGHWNEAEEEYLQVLHMMDQEEEPNQYAATLNNLAFVYMLNGNPIRADNLAEKALRMRREQGNIHGLGFSYSTRGRIAEALGDQMLALRYHRTAVDLCELVGDTNNAALMQVNVAAAECYAQRFETAHLLLSRGLRSDLPNIRARALQQAARIDIEEGKSLNSQGASPDEVRSRYENAERYANQALELAQQVLDDHLTASVLLDLVTIAFLKDQQRDEEHWRMLEGILKDHNYKLEKGLLTEMEGNFAYLQDDMMGAFEHYLEACTTLAQYSPATFRAAFDHLRDKFLEAPRTIQQQLCKLIHTRYADIHPESHLVALKELCIDIIVPMK
jgi:tetratricopeptide (TPR) repeat protein